MPFVVDRNILALNGRPEGLEMAVEKEGVESAGRGDMFAEGEEVCWFGVGIFGREGNWGGGSVEGGSRIAEEIHLCSLRCRNSYLSHCRLAFGCREVMFDILHLITN